MTALVHGCSPTVAGATRLSRLGALLRPDAVHEFDAIVVGSGFGAAVAAARLAPVLGDGLVVLERGAEYLPGEFPETLADAAGHRRSEANPFGMYDIGFHRDVDTVVANLVGGGSQLYCGVTIEPSPETFEIGRSDAPGGRRRAWPDEIDHAALRPYYDRVRGMLEPEVWQRPMRRSLAFDTAAGRVFGPGASTPVPLAVTIQRYAAGQVNRHGVPRHPCTGCGACVTGCNVGAKNALTTNYLPEFLRYGGHLHAGAEVRHVRPATGRRRWAVGVTVRDGLGGRHHRVLHADTVVLAAGVLGTGSILASSRHRGLSLSPRLGSRVSGNGDAIAVAHRWSGEFAASLPIEVDELPGPTITRSVDRRRVPGQRFLVQDSVAPQAVAGALARVLGLRHGTGWADGQRAEEDLQESLMMLAMGYDSASGHLVERGGRMQIEWARVDSEPVHRATARAMRTMADVVGASYAANPRSGTRGSGTPVSVHLLGGAPMGSSSRDAVVDPAGRLLDAAGRAHPGLYVTDASVIPTAVGANPALLIAALAERCADVFLAEDAIGPGPAAGR